MDVEEDLFCTESLFYTDRVKQGAAHVNCVERIIAAKRKHTPFNPYAPVGEVMERLHARVSSEEGFIVVLYRSV